MITSKLVLIINKKTHELQVYFQAKQTPFASNPVVYQ